MTVEQAEKILQQARKELEAKAMTIDAEGYQRALADREYFALLNDEMKSLTTKIIEYDALMLILSASKDDPEPMQRIVAEGALKSAGINASQYRTMH